MGVDSPKVQTHADVFHSHRTIQQSALLTPEESTHLGKFLDAKELVKLRHPLQAALLFSPLYLLTGRKMLNNSWDQTRMLQVGYSPFSKDTVAESD